MADQFQSGCRKTSNNLLYNKDTSKLKKLSSAPLALGDQLDKAGVWSLLDLVVEIPEGVILLLNHRNQARD